MEFHVLGPLEVVRQGRALEIGAGKKRALLAALLLHANEVVSTDRLIDELWGERAPATAPKIVQGYVSQLRKVLAGETGCQDRQSGGSILLTRPPGYVLQLEEGQLDADRFAALLAKARAVLAAGAAHDASTLLREALGLWRGPPLADFAFDSFAQEEISRLEELRLAALEERIDADLALARQRDLVAELEALVARHPLRERLRGQLMIALYRCGRQAEALQVYQETRRVLVEELGLEPSRVLQQVEQAILRQDPSLDLLLPAAPSEPGAEPRRVGRPAPERWPGSVFVGRERELAALRSALADALSGRGRLVLIGGEPGIGKSRLAEEVASRARDSRAEVLWGRCWEAGGAPSYWPWVQAIRACVHNRSPERLRAELGPGAAAIAELVADVRERLPDLEVPSTLADPQQARFRLFDSIAGFFKNASRTRPLVLVLDDLNWADKGSLLLLEFVTRELADAYMLVIGTYRDIELSRQHPLSQTLGELARERLFERVLLRGLSHEDVERFIEAACAFAPDQALVHAVHTQTEGNPFFVSEVVRLLTEEGALTPEALGTRERWSARIPEGVREAIGRRLDRLSQPCNETLAVASAIGRDFALDQLVPLIDDLSEDGLLEVLEEALAAHVIEELPAAAGRYQFTHALIQGTLAEELSLSRRARVHARIAQALEVLYAADAERHAAELAHHFAAAQAVLGAEKLIQYSLLAGEAALAAHAHEEALGHFQRALAAKEGHPLDDRTAALHFGLGRAQLATLEAHELGQAVTNLRLAFEYYFAAGDVGRAVGVAAHPLPLSVGIGRTEIVHLVARALDLVPPDSDDAGRLLSTYGWFLGVSEANYEGARSAFDRALAIAQAQDDASLERRVLANAAFLDAFHLHWEGCVANGQRAIELAVRADDHATEMAARRYLAWAAIVAGEREQAREHAAGALAFAKKLRGRWWLASTSYNNVLVSLYEGDWPAARETGELGLVAQPRDPRHLGLRAVLEYEQGEPEAGAAQIEQLLEGMRSVPPPGPIAEHVFVAAFVPLVDRIAAGAGRLDVAEAAADAVLSLPRLAPALAILARAGQALTAVGREDRTTAERLYAALEPHRGTAIYALPLATDRLLGLLALTADRVDAALAHFEDALAFCERSGYRPQYAWTACEYAQALLTRGGSTDRGRALALHDEALGIARQLGMRPLTERVLADRETLLA